MFLDRANRKKNDFAGSEETRNLSIALLPIRQMTLGSLINEQCSDLWLCLLLSTLKAATSTLTLVISAAETSVLRVSSAIQS